MTRNFLHDAAHWTVESPSAEPRSEASVLPNRCGEIAQASRTFLAELEASLEASQRALLSRDVARLEQCTSEQLRLRRSLEILWSPNQGHLSGSNSRHPDPALAIQLRTAQVRVLHLGRVQAALLDRAQRWLRTVTHLLAGLDQSYVLPACSQVPQYTSPGSEPSMSRHTKEAGPEQDEGHD